MYVPKEMSENRNNSGVWWLSLKFLAWKIPRTEEPDMLQSMGSQRVGHDWATSLSFFSFFFKIIVFDWNTPTIKKKNKETNEAGMVARKGHLDCWQCSMSAPRCWVHRCTHFMNIPCTVHLGYVNISVHMLLQWEAVRMLLQWEAENEKKKHDILKNRKADHFMFNWTHSEL